MGGSISRILVYSTEQDIKLDPDQPTQEQKITERLMAEINTANSFPHSR